MWAVGAGLLAGWKEHVGGGIEDRGVKSVL